MSAAYDAYLITHKNCVREAFSWLNEHVPQVLEELDKTLDWDIGYYHDASKNDDAEYKAYDAYFYGGNKSYQVVKDFEVAWLHHIHNNPHHWQYWVLIEDDTGKPKALEMPEEYIIEMICDWWSFSFRSGDLREIFSWYADHEKKMILHEKTRKRIDYILKEINDYLDEQESLEEEREDVNPLDPDEMMHEGVKGQKWGVRHGPPYSLSPDVNAQVRMNAKHGGAKWEPENTKEEVKAIQRKNEEEHPVEKIEDLKKHDGSAGAIKEARAKANHGDPTSLGRHFNCPNCAAAFEMIERGYDVEARPAKNGSNVGDVSKFFKDGKMTLATSGIDVDIPSKEEFDKNPRAYHNKVLGEYDKVIEGVTKNLTSQGDGARGIIVTGWAKGTDWSGLVEKERTTAFHAFNYKVEKGEVKYYDVQGRSKREQNGYTDPYWIYNSDYRDIYSIRTDNLELSDDICKAVYSSGKKGGK